MSSILKSNKNLISKIIRDLESSIKSGRGDIYNLNLDVVVKEAWEARVSMQFSVDTRVKAIEEDGIVYIGLDLTAPKKLSYNPSHYRNSYEEIIMFHAFPYYSRGDDALQKFIGASSIDDVKNNPSLMEPAIRILDKKVLDILSSFEAEVELRNEMFPRLKNRKFMPLFILDSSKGTLNYCKDSRAVNSRQGRVNINIFEYSRDRSVKTASRTAIYNYCRVKITHPEMRTYTY